MRGRFLLCVTTCLSLAGLLAGCHKTPSITQMQSQDLLVGSGYQVQKGDQVFVHYRGWLEDGTEFDSNGVGKDPYGFEVGKASVIPGWDQGVIGMKEGGKRRLKIPPALAYGDQGNGKVPGGAVLNFDIELVKVIKGGDLNTVTIKTTKQGSGAACKAGDKITITYVAKGMGGNKVDSSDDHGGPVTFHVGKDELNSRGLDAAIIGMKVGEVREITLPPDMSVTAPTPMAPPTMQIATVTLIKIG